MRQSTLLITAAAVAIVTAAVVALPAFADSKTYGLSGFDRVDVSAGIDVTLSQGPFSIRADEPDGNFDKLIVELRGDTLRIWRRNDWFDWRGIDYSVAVSAPNYVGLDVSSGARSKATTSSSGHQGRRLLRANVELSGSCAGLRVDVSSGADFDGEDLKCETASVDASSSADADAFAARSASSNASSGANVTFHGKPATLPRTRRAAARSARARRTRDRQHDQVFLDTACRGAGRDRRLRRRLLRDGDENYDLAGFDSVSARSSVNVVLRQGPIRHQAEGPKTGSTICGSTAGLFACHSREPTTSVGWLSSSDRDVVTVSAPDYHHRRQRRRGCRRHSLRLDALEVKAGGGADVNVDGLTLATLRIDAGGGARRERTRAIYRYADSLGKRRRRHQRFRRLRCAVG